MSSFLSRLKASANSSIPSAANAPAKKDSQSTPLEKLLADAGPIRADGSDKFFGFENFGSTCYCNSIIQCLYYSVPFREQVLNFPSRTFSDDIHSQQITALPQINTDVDLSNGTNATVSPTKNKALLPGSAQASPRKPSPNAHTLTPIALKPEDNKDSPEYKKKQAMVVGPVVNMDYENSRSYGMPESLFTALKDIFEAIIAHKSRSGVVSPNKFLEILKRDNEMFRTAMHQDAHEFLNLLLNQVVESVEEFSKNAGDSDKQGSISSNGTVLPISAAAAMSLPSNQDAKSNTDWVHDLFEGTLTSETRCLTCENTSQRDEAFLDLSVDLDQHSSVTSCLRKFSEEEMLCERNKFHCDNCGGLQEAEKRMKIKRLPRILALHLKRFKYTEDLQRLQKLFHRVVYPYYLRLFNTTDDAEDPDRLYELYAVVIHIGGGPYHGHYVSIIKTRDRGWLLFDDEMVEPVDKGFVRNFFGGENLLACAYVLFYQETTVEAMQKEQEADSLAAMSGASEGLSDAQPAGAKLNGASSTNGQYPGPNITSPVIDDREQFPNLDHAITAPSQTPQAVAESLPLETTVTSPTFLGLGLRKGEVKSRKEAAKEEKARKLAEKEHERVEKQKRKDAEIALKDSDKRYENNPDTTNTNVTHANSEAAFVSSNALDEMLYAKENGSGIMSGGLHRFKQGSVSLRQKSRFWSSKDKHERDQPEKTEAHDGHEPVSTADEKREKPKAGRFSLSRKKSTFL